jgi:hypothetical protein
LTETTVRFQTVIGVRFQRNIQPGGEGVDEGLSIAKTYADALIKFTRRKNENRAFIPRNKYPCFSALPHK